MTPLVLRMLLKSLMPLMLLIPPTLLIPLQEKVESINTSIDINTPEENNITNDNPNLKQLDANDRPTSEDTSRVIENSTKLIKGHHSTKFKSDRSSASRMGKKLSSKTKNANITPRSKSRKGRNADSG